MKYYFLTYDRRHGFLDDRVHDLLGLTPQVSEQAWADAGGESLGPDASDTPLWGVRPGHLLIDEGLRSGWVDRFGSGGVLTTSLGSRDMFLVVPDGNRDSIAPPGDWKQWHYFSTHLWTIDGGRKIPPYALALRFDLADPVVRPWDSTGALATLYSEEVVAWLQSVGATGVSFSLVWDPERTALPPVGESHAHECIVL